MGNIASIFTRRENFAEELKKLNEQITDAEQRILLYSLSWRRNSIRLIYIFTAIFILYAVYYKFFCITEYSGVWHKTWTLTVFVLIPTVGFLLLKVLGFVYGSLIESNRAWALELQANRFEKINQFKKKAPYNDVVGVLYSPEFIGAGTPYKPGIKGSPMMYSPRIPVQHRPGAKTAVNQLVPNAAEYDQVVRSPLNSSIEPKVNGTPRSQNNITLTKNIAKTDSEDKEYQYPAFVPLSVKDGHQGHNHSDPTKESWITKFINYVTGNGVTMVPRLCESCKVEKGMVPAGYNAQFFCDKCKNQKLSPKNDRNRDSAILDSNSGSKSKED